MGRAWHKEKPETRREWVAYLLAGVALLIIAGVALGVVFAARSKTSEVGSPTAPSAAALGAAVAQQPPAAAVQVVPPSPPAAAVAEQSFSPTAQEPPSQPAAGGSVPNPLPSPAPPPPAKPSNAPPAGPAGGGAPAGGSGTAPSTYDPSFVAKGFQPVAIPPGKERTCELTTKRNYLCNDGMDTAQGPGFEVMQLMLDPEMMAPCNHTDMDAIVNSLVKWAYKSKCGVESYTVARACIGTAGTAGEGHWRARLMLWPAPGSAHPSCTPLCIKIRGQGAAAYEYGRHGSCNEAKPAARRRRRLAAR